MAIKRPKIVMVLPWPKIFVALKWLKVFMALKWPKIVMALPWPKILLTPITLKMKRGDKQNFLKMQKQQQQQK